MKTTKRYVFSTWNFILLFVPLFFYLVSPVYSADVSFQWDPSSELDLAGYRVFSREEGKSYNYNVPAWEGTTTTCTIYKLDDTKNYYFVLRSFDTQGLQSGDSNELYLEAAITPDNGQQITNQAPSVDAGSNQTINLPADGVVLNATCTDDGLPSGVLTTVWDQLSGPANQVVFDDAYATQTTATFLSVGTYLLQLTADDGELTASDQITINVMDTESNQSPTCVLNSQFQKAILTNNITYYTDHNYTLTSVPDDYVGMDMIKTPNKDRKLTTDSDYLTFEMPYDGTVYVAYDSRATSLPNWMGGFSNIGDRIYTSQNKNLYLIVYSRAYSSGDCVNLGGNMALGFSGKNANNYIVLVDSK